MSPFGMGNQIELIWRYDPSWTDNAISPRVSCYGLFTLAFITYGKCVICM